MNRRKYLGILAATTAVPGCLGTSSTPTASDRPLSEYDCPPEGVATSNVVCSQTNGSTETPNTLEASPTVAADPSDIVLTLRNVSDESQRFNPGAWKRWVERSGSWEQIEKEGTGGAVYSLEPGESYQVSPVEAINAFNNRFEMTAGTYLLVLQVDPSKQGALFRITSE